MSGDNFTDGSKTRAVLGDVTNLPLKRGFSLVSGELRLKSEDRYGKNLVSKDGDSYFAKQVCLGIENLVKEKCKTKFFGYNSGEKGLSPPTVSRIGESLENIVSVVSHRPEEIKEVSNLFDGSVNFGKSGAMTSKVGEVGDASGDSCGSSGSMPTSDDEGRLTLNVTRSNLARQGFDSRICTRDLKDFDVGGLSGGKYGSIGWSNLPKSQGSKSFELGRCTSLKEDSCANLNAGADLLKACSCSFCLKAAYIWSDLYYQDIKGRISALKRSQKEASILVNKYARGKQTDIHNQGNSNKSSKLESDLTGQWRTLFRHMEDIFAHECNQLQASFATLKDLRENCKTDLEGTTGMPPDKY